MTHPLSPSTPTHHPGVWMLTIIILSVMFTTQSFAIGEAATSFNIYVPPNNDHNGRDVALIVTALDEAGTTVDIIDDDADGDDDDTVLGVQLGRGQSYILYLKQGAVNDDAGGKWDGDYFKIRANHVVVVQMATRSNWQHDWAPGQSKSSRDTNFFIWAPPTSGDDNDINIYAYEPDTVVEIEDVTRAATIASGPSDVDLSAGQLILKKRLDRGEDLIVRNDLGVDVLDPGHTYWIKASKPVTVQYGHLGSLLGRNSVRDGGGFVPGNTGSTVSDSFYFAIPHHPGAPGEKELRVVSYDDNVTFTLMGWSDVSGGFEVIEQRSMQRFEHLDYVGHHHAGFRDAELYHVTVSPPGKAVTLFEASWLETGSSGTSDYASSVSSSEGSGAGTEFVTYLGPPGYEQNWTASPQPGEARLSHLFLYAFAPGTIVTIEDADTGGQIISEQVAIPRDGYYDFAVDMATYEKLTLLGRRPYVHVTSTQPIAIHNTNFNDNWMAYATSPMRPDPMLHASASSEVVRCGETIDLVIDFGTTVQEPLTDAHMTLHLPAGFAVETASLVSSHPDVTLGVTTIALDGSSTVAFDLSKTGLPSLITYQMTLSLTLDCASAVGCVEEGLADIHVTLHGKDALLDLYENRAHVSIRMERSALNQVQEILSFFDDSSSSARIGFTVSAEDGLALYEVTRSTQPDGQATTIAYLSSHGASTQDTSYWFSDYSVTQGSGYFYRVEVLEPDGCSTLHGPFYVKLETSSSSGGNGGLESNGRMADQLAIRALERRFLSLDVTRSMTLGAQPVSLPELLIPLQGPPHTISVQTSPRDLEFYTNAEHVAAHDYVDVDTGRVLASVLITQTRGATYEHSKGLCDRAGGSILHDLYYEPLEQRQGHFLTRYHLEDPRTHQSDWSTSFKLYESAPGTWHLHSAWIRRDYPQVNPDQRVLNVQVWANKPGIEVLLAERVLDQLDGTLMPPSNPSTDLVEPQIYIESASTLGARTTLALHWDEASQHTRCLLRAHEISAQTGRMMTLEHVLNRALVQDAHMEVTIQSDPFLDVTVELECEGHVIDEVWLSDGAWTALTDELWGGASTTEALSLNGCEPRDMLPALPYPDGDHVETPRDIIRFAGCGSIHGKVDGFVGLARHFGGAHAPLTMTEHDIVSAFVTSDHDIEVCLHSRSTPGQRALCHVWEAAPQGAWRTMHLGLIDLEEHVTRQHFNEIYMITFGVTRQDATVQLEVSHLEMAYQQLTRNETEAGPLMAEPVDVFAPYMPTEPRDQGLPLMGDKTNENNGLNESTAPEGGCQNVPAGSPRGPTWPWWLALCFVLRAHTRRCQRIAATQGGTPWLTSTSSKTFTPTPPSLTAHTPSRRTSTPQSERA